MKGIEAVCWDVDNTLVDNHGVFEHVVQSLNEKYHLTYKQEYPLGGCLNTLWNALRSPDDLTFEHWKQELNETCFKSLKATSLKPYAERCIQLFDAQGFSQSCVSNSFSKVIEHTLTITGIASFFHHWVGRDHVSDGKPSPESYLKSCHDHGKHPSRCLAIEDSSTGVMAAKQAGLTVIAVSSPYVPVHTLHQADYLMADLEELLHFWETSAGVLLPESPSERSSSLKKPWQMRLKGRRSDREVSRLNPSSW